VDALSSTRGHGLLAAALRTWLRYLVPLTLLSAIALSPLLYLAMTARIPADATAAAALRRLSWELVALAIVPQLVLVGAAAPITRNRPSQLRALASGLTGLLAALLPCIAAVAAIALGILALVVPGLILLPLLALTGASTERGIRARLLDSITIARRNLRPVVLTVLALLAVDVAIGVFAHLQFSVPFPKRPSPAQLTAARHVIQSIAVALVVVSPLLATVLAMIRRSSDSRPATTAR
jgi:hypothetical protein